MTVYNESKFPAPLSVQVLDAADNICKQADVKVQIAKDPKLKVFEPVHEIMVILVLGKLILQTRMRSDPVGLDCADAQARLSLR